MKESLRAQAMDILLRWYELRDDYIRGQHGDAEYAAYHDATTQYLEALEELFTN